jgi:hypothetical protein
MRRRAALLAVILLVAACATPAGRPVADGPATAREGSPSAPFGTVDAVGGGQIDGGELAGQDLALWFWAPW